MPGISLTATEGIGDVLGNWRFQLEIQPSAAANNSVVQALMLRCQQVDFSGVTVETVQVGLHGHEVNFRGRSTFTKTISATFVETYDGQALNALLNWKEAVVGTRSGNGLYKSQYSSLGLLSILDPTGAVTHSQQIFYMFPTEVNNINLDSAASGPVLITTTFSYDFAIKQQGVTYDDYGTEPTV
jgi:hypothetical protein